MSAKKKTRELPGDPESWPRIAHSFTYSDPENIRKKADDYYGDGMGGDFFESDDALNRALRNLSIKVARMGGPIHYRGNEMGWGSEMDIERLHAIAVILYHTKPRNAAAEVVGRLTERLVTERSAEKAARGLELLAQEIRDKGKFIKRKRVGLPVYQAAIDHILEFRTLPTNEILGGRCKELGIAAKTYYAVLTEINGDIGKRLTRGYNA